VPVAIIPEIGAALMRTTWLTDIRTWPAPRPGDDGVSLLAEALREALPERGRIGLPMGPETVLRMPLADHARLAEALAPRAFVDATAIVQRTREIKSEAEIAAIRATCETAGAAFARVADFAGPGRPLDAVYRDFQAACLAAGADWVSYLAGGAGPGGYGDVISPATAQPLAPGDVLMLDTGAVRGGYFCDFDRNFAIGHAGDESRRAHAILFAATESGIAAARPGVTAADMHAAIAGAIEAAGATPLTGRLGHGLGLSLTEWPSFTPDDRTPLRAGMVLAIEPGLELAPGRIMVHEENVVLRETGTELLSPRAPAELPVIA
jgi:Xaa-Pro aminopeptidase